MGRLKTLARDFSIVTDSPLAFSNAPNPVFADASNGAATPLCARAAVAALASDVGEIATTEGSVAARRLRHLSQIGLALSAERDIRRLLAMILSTSRELTCADGGTLYIVEKDAQSGQKKLFFRASQNDSITVDTNMSFAVGPSSLAGYAALTDTVLRFDDVYQLAPDAPYQFNPRFDIEHNYRTKSVLVVPMHDHDGEVIGVLQLINRKKRRETLLCDAATVENQVIGFDPDLAELAAILASQAAVALNANLLRREIENLFESFVIAASTAIEDRDPTTSGHSQRVTQLTLGLAKAINEQSDGPYRLAHFTQTQLRELRYAALLHDFGKIGVREAVLTKSHKIESNAFNAICNRILALKNAWQAQSFERRLQIALDSGFDETEKAEKIADEAQIWCARLAQLDADARVLENLNDPAQMPNSPDHWARGVEALERLSCLFYTDKNGMRQPLLSAEEVATLQVRRGTLTPSEFAQIQDHAQMSRDFLNQIPWTRELEAVPAIAHAHHERNDGSGYPLGLNESQIPLGAKIMAIADVYDALTASDRPYKRAMTTDEALQILHEEVERGKLDGALLEIFIAQKVWREVSE